MIKVHAPASIANLSVGFDVLGAAIAPIDGRLLGDNVCVTAAKTFSLEVEGYFSHQLPAAYQQNILYQCWQRFCQEIGQEIPIAVRLEKNMPVGSGLGSSACSIVAGLIAMNEFCNQPLDPMKLLGLMGALEGRIAGSIHYDNVAPCYLGGMQLILEQKGIISHKVPGFEDWLWVIAYPGISVSTAQARAILPKLYSLQDCISHGRDLAGFIHACHTGQPDLAASLMHDVIAEPYRSQLLPGFTTVKLAAQSIGALACGISGSGPTVFAVCNNTETAQCMQDWLQQNWLQNDEGFVHLCRLDTAGARLME